MSILSTGQTSLLGAHRAARLDPLAGAGHLAHLVARMAPDAIRFGLSPHVASVVGTTWRTLGGAPMAEEEGGSAIRSALAANRREAPRAPGVGLLLPANGEWIALTVLMAPLPEPLGFGPLGLIVEEERLHTGPAAVAFQRMAEDVQGAQRTLAVALLNRPMPRDGLPSGWRFGIAAALHAAMRQDGPLGRVAVVSRQDDLAPARRLPADVKTLVREVDAPMPRLPDGWMPWQATTCHSGSTRRPTHVHVESASPLGAAIAMLSLAENG